MDHTSTPTLRVGDWEVDPIAGSISRDGHVVRVEARTMRLLVFLAQRAGDLVSIDQLLKEVWSGVIVTSDSVYQAVTSLRRVLGDDPKQPTYIVTVPRRGYRLVAKVTALTNQLDSPTAHSLPTNGDDRHGMTLASPPRRPRHVRQLLLVGACALIVAVIAAYARRNHLPQNEGQAHHPSSAVTARRSIAVVPFIDLTAEMGHEYWADGMTEEIIDKLSKAPDLQVAAPTSSFYLKGKQIAIADIAKTLGVAYVLDGSVRKSGSTLRVAARLSRGDNGYVVWSETYDRPVGDILTVQENIASAVTLALRSSIDSG